jgi:uncharacterized membrane protein YtjA (UPF0391 family)
MLGLISQNGRVP